MQQAGRQAGRQAGAQAQQAQQAHTANRPHYAHPPHQRGRAGGACPARPAWLAGSAREAKGAHFESFANLAQPNQSSARRRLWSFPVLQFRATHGIIDPMYSVTGGAVFWRRTAPELMPEQTFSRKEYDLDAGYSTKPPYLSL